MNAGESNLGVTWSHTHSISSHSRTLQTSPKTGVFQVRVSNTLDKLESYDRIKRCRVHKTQTNSSASSGTSQN